MVEDYPVQFSVGDTCTYNTVIDLTDPIEFHEEMACNAEVVGTEEIALPKGTINFYKVETTGTGGAMDEATNTYWWAVDEDYLCPVKYTYAYIVLGEQNCELKSYTPVAE